MERAAHNGGPLLTSRGLSKEEEHLLPVEVPGRNEAAHKTASAGGFQVLFPTGWSPNPTFSPYFLCSHLLSSRLNTLGLGGLRGHCLLQHPHHLLTGCLAQTWKAAREKTWPGFPCCTAAFMQVWLMCTDTLLPARLPHLDPRH